MLNFKIETYSFGRMIIEGREYDSDLIIYPDGSVRDGWERKDGHNLFLEDIEDLVETNPDMILAGTGSSGMMTPDPSISIELKKIGIDFRAAPSRIAAELYNELHMTEKIGACFHLTC